MTHKVMLLSTVLLISSASAQMGGESKEQSGSKRNAGIRSELDKINRNFEAAAAKKDAKTIAQMYHSAGRMLGHGAPAAVGREQIEKTWQGYFDAGFADLRLETQSVERHGDVIVELGRFTNTFGGKPDVGKYVVIWKKEGGQWKLWVDSFSSDGPAAATS